MSSDFVTKNAKGLIHRAIAFEYNLRFSKLRDAQKAWVKQFDVREYRFCPYCNGRCEFDDGTPQPPRRTSSHDLGAARVALREAAREFLLCCYRTGLMNEADLRTMCARIGTGLEPSELDRTALDETSAWRATGDLL